MRFGNLIFGVALLLVASTLALTITFRNGAPEPASASSGRPSGTQTVASDTAQRGAIPHNPPARSQRSGSGSGSGSSEVPRPPRQKLPAVEELDLVLADGPSAPPLSPVQRQEISQRTASVKRAALAKLDKMTERLDLTPAQRHKIYPNLIRSTNGYHQAMVIAYPVGGYPIEVASNDPKTESKSPDEAIHDALDPDQQDDFVEDKIDERAWWNEIVAQLEEDFDTSVVAAATAPPEEEPQQEDPDPAPTPDAPAEEPAPAGPQQGGNIFDLLNQ